MFRQSFIIEIFVIISKLWVQSIDMWFLGTDSDRVV